MHHYPLAMAVDKLNVPAIYAKEIISFVNTYKTVICVQ